jgi:N-acetylglutamate synthase-like GNAT family acetyltransferase
MEDDRVKIVVRKGNLIDGPGAINVLPRSVSELCVADHEGDELEVADWLSNKTKQAWVDWLNRKDATVLIAEKPNEIVGVGLIDHRGRVLQNYVRPDARFSGVSEAVLESLESAARQMGHRRCFLEGTKTAKQFYEHCGYNPVTANSLWLEKLL